MSVQKYVFAFEENRATPETIFLLGNKGAQLAELTSIGLPVPPGFTISTEACRAFFENNRRWPRGLKGQVEKALRKLERKMNKRFGDSKNPLLVSVRSGSYVSMPGMMDTVLNLGLNDSTVFGLARQTKNERMAFDSYRRFIHMFGDVVMGVPHEKFEQAIHQLKKRNGAQSDTDLSAADLKKLVSIYKSIVQKHAGKSFPTNPRQQLDMSIDAVFSSWNTPRAIKYRKINNLKKHAGTGVNVQAMVFGNMGNDSATGVGFTRNPATGRKEHYGEFLVNAQGEDVVAGIRTPEPIDKLAQKIPNAYRELIQVYGLLERHYKDLQDFEFTIEKGKLYLLQTRSGKRTAQAAVKIAVDFVREGLISREEALLLVKPQQLDQLLHKQLSPAAKKTATVIARGLPASPGAAVGQVVFSADKAVKLYAKDKHAQLLLVRTETSPEDIEGMHVSQGFLTARGGLTCIGEETQILTDQGMFPAKKVFELLETGARLRILSFDKGSMQTTWRPIIAAGRNQRECIEVSVSQTGRTQNNSLVITPDHKMYVFENRELAKKPLENVLADENSVCLVDRIPSLGSQASEKMAYLVGAVVTDGYIGLRRTKGMLVFTQKECQEKQAFIGRFKDYFAEVFDYELHSHTKYTSSVLKGRPISGTATDFYCTKRAIVLQFQEIVDQIVPWVLSLDEDSLLSFIGGALDGDGSLNGNRLQLYASKEHVTKGIILACLRLGVVPQVSVNRNIFNIQIRERVKDILEFSARLNGKTSKMVYGSKLFGARELFMDVMDLVNNQGRVKERVNRNLFYDADKIRDFVLPQTTGKLTVEMERLLGSALRMYRIHKVADVGVMDVYNFEVDAEKEIDKNFVVFTKRFTPLLVSNSHAAVVARGMGKPCVSGSNDIIVEEKNKEFLYDGKRVQEGAWVSIDGGTGEVFLGKLPVTDPTFSKEFGTLMRWADRFRTMKVRANAETPLDAKRGREFGAEGIGLARTEHMFFDKDRINAMREMIVASDEAGRRRALVKLLPMQRADFKQLFKVMSGLPVTIRLLDPPLHEFLPKDKTAQLIIAHEMDIPYKTLKRKVKSLHEINPMLGHRGCRLGLTYPEINEMQCRAIFEAALAAKQEGHKPIPEIEVPLVGSRNELRDVRKIVDRIASETGARGKIRYKVGTMIELPRACLTADRIAAYADFMSFGTNDLTQTTYGYSRDDVGKFVPMFVERAILPIDPFQTLDRRGVGRLMRICIQDARSVKKDMEFGICGEHGGEPQSVEFCHELGLNYVSCSPFRVPIARLAAAQAAVREKFTRAKAKPARRHRK